MNYHSTHPTEEDFQRGQDEFQRFVEGLLFAGQELATEANEFDRLAAFTGIAHRYMIELDPMSDEASRILIGLVYASLAYGAQLSQAGYGRHALMN